MPAKGDDLFILFMINVLFQNFILDLNDQHETKNPQL
jgi:hypothetical protein